MWVHLRFPGSRRPESPTDNSTSMRGSGSLRSTRDSWYGDTLSSRFAEDKPRYLTVSHPSRRDFSPLVADEYWRASMEAGTPRLLRLSLDSSVASVAEPWDTVYTFSNVPLP